MSGRWIILRNLIFRNPSCGPNCGQFFLDSSVNCFQRFLADPCNSTFWNFRLNAIIISPWLAGCFLHLQRWPWLGGKWKKAGCAVQPSYPDRPTSASKPLSPCHSHLISFNATSVVKCFKSYKFYHSGQNMNRNDLRIWPFGQVDWTRSAVIQPTMWGPKCAHKRPKCPH